MKKEMKNYRIVSEKGEALLITQKCFHNLLATLDALANGERMPAEQERHSNKKRLSR
jgi:hypothetical protein